MQAQPEDYSSSAPSISSLEQISQAVKATSGGYVLNSTSVVDSTSPNIVGTSSQSSVTNSSNSLMAHAPPHPEGNGYYTHNNHHNRTDGLQSLVSVDAPYPVPHTAAVSTTLPTVSAAGGSSPPTTSSFSSSSSSTSSGSTPTSSSSAVPSFPVLNPFFNVLQHRERKAALRHAALEAVTHSDLSRLVLPDPDNPMAIVGLPPLPGGMVDASSSSTPGAALANPLHGVTGGGRGGAAGFPISTAAAPPPPAPFFSPQYLQDSHPVNSDALNASEKKLLTKIVVDRAVMAAAAENRRQQATQVILGTSGGKLAQPYGPPVVPAALAEGNSCGGGSGVGGVSNSSNNNARPGHPGGGDHFTLSPTVPSTHFLAGDSSSNHGATNTMATTMGGISSSSSTATSASVPPPLPPAAGVNYALDIFHAACDGDAMMLAYNIYYGADINGLGQPNPMYYDGKPLEKRWSFCAPPLVFAAAFGRERAVRALLAWGADVHGRSSTGLEAKDYAAKRGYSAIVSMLEAEERKAEAKKPKIILVRK